MDNIGPLSYKQKTDAVKLEQERARLAALQAKAQQEVNKVAEVPKAIEPVPLTDAQVIAKESSGNPLAKNPNSSAYGLYQMTDAARIDAVKVNPKLASMDYKDPLVQEQYRTAYKQSISNQLNSFGVDTKTLDENDYNRAWVVGPYGYSKIKSALPSTPLENILKPDAISKNKNLQNKTAGEFLTNNDPYSIAGKVSEPPVYRASINPRDTMKVPPVGPIDETGLVNVPMTEGYNSNGGIDAADDPEAQAFAPISTNNLSVVPPLQDNATKRDNSSGGIDAADDPEAQAFAPISTNNLSVVPPLQDNADQVTPVTVESGVVPPLDETDLPPLTSTQQKTIDSLGAAGGTVNPASIADTLVGVSGDSIIGGPNSGSEEDKAKLPDTFWKELSKSFKDLFTDKEFIRFGILLAGGMLTGGSFGGSLKYAGLYALQSADKREVATAAATVTAKAAAAKDLSDRGNAIDKSLASALANTSIPDNQRNFALQQMRKNDTLPLAQRVAANSDLLEGLNSLATNKKGYKPIQRVVDGTITNLYEDLDNGTFSTRTVDDKNNVSFTVVPNTLSVDEFKKLNSDVRDAISSMVGAYLDPELKNLGDIKNNIAQQTLDATTHMTTYGSTIQARDVAQMAKVAMNTVGTYIAGTDYAEWSSKYVGALYTQAAVRIAPTRKELFMNPEGLPLSAPAYARIRTELAGDKLEPGLTRLIGEYEKYRDNASTTKVDITLPNNGSLKVPKDVATYLNQNKAESPLTAYLHLRSLGKVGKVN